MAERCGRIYEAREKKLRLKIKIFQDAKERGGPGLLDLKIFYASCCFLWLKAWFLQQNRTLLNLEECFVRFDWCSIYGMLNLSNI